MSDSLLRQQLRDLRNRTGSDSLIAELEIDLIYDCVDNWMHAGEWGKIDEFIESIDLETASEHVVLAALVISLPCRSKLKTIDKFVSDVKQLPEYCDSLEGLE